MRITPDEVHFDDPEIIDYVFPTGGRKTAKPAWLHTRTGSMWQLTIQLTYILFCGPLTSLISTRVHILYGRSRHSPATAQCRQLVLLAS